MDSEQASGVLSTIGGVVSDVFGKKKKQQQQAAPMPNIPTSKEINMKSLDQYKAKYGIPDIAE